MEKIQKSNVFLFQYFSIRFQKTLPKNIKIDSTPSYNFLLLLSLQNTDSSTVSTSSLSLLTLNSQSPHVSDTSVQPDFLHSFQIFSQFVGQSIRSQLGIFTVLDILLSIQKPGRDFEVFRVSHGGLDSFQFFGIDLTGSFVDIDFGFFQDQVGESSAHTLNGGQSVSDFDVTINVGVLDTENVLEVFVVDDEGHFWLVGVFFEFYTTFSVRST